MEYLDIVDRDGNPTGETVSRETAHRDGIRHRTAHVWIVRRTGNGWEILLQKRSMEKESFPGYYEVLYSFQDTVSTTGTGKARLYVVVTDRRNGAK